MSPEKIPLVIFALVVFTLWILSRVFRWDELTYEQFKDSSIMWFWLDFFGIAKTRQNCLRFMRALWIVTLIVVSVGTIAALRSGR